MNNKVNLNTIVNELTRAEGLKKRQSVAQMKEMIGLLGTRWRNMTEEEYLQEASCIRERAGLLSEHNSKDPE
jgi:hypothetical protein